MGHEAPAVTIQFLQARGKSISDLRSGETDIIIGPNKIINDIVLQSSRLAQEFAIEPLADEPFACLARKNDTAFARGLTLEEYLAWPHASFCLDLDAHASLEHKYLVDFELKQFSRIIASDFLILPLIAAQSDCIVLVPRSLANQAIQTLPLQIGPSPLPVPNLELVMVMLRRRYHDSEMAWLRQMLQRCSSVMNEGARTLALAQSTAS